MTREILRVDPPPAPGFFYNFPAPDEGLLDEFRTRVQAAVRYAISCINKYKQYFRRPRVCHQMIDYDCSDGHLGRRQYFRSNIVLGYCRFVKLL